MEDNKEHMELVVAESAVYLPPLIIGALVYFYRNSILPLSSFKIISVISNQLLLRKNQLIEVIHYGSQMVYKFKNTLHLTISTLLQGPLIVYQNIVKLLTALRLQVHLVTIQVSNITQSAFSKIATFFHPPQKTSWDTIVLGCLILGGIAVTLLAWCYLRKTPTSTPLEDSPVKEEPVVEKKAVRRKRKAN